MSTLTIRNRADAGEVLAQSFGHCIATKRKVYGLIQEMRSDRLSVDPKSMARLEGGEVLPSLQRTFEISKALDVPVSELLSEAPSNDRN